MKRAAMIVVGALTVIPVGILVSLFFVGGGQCTGTASAAGTTPEVCSTPLSAYVPSLVLMGLVVALVALALFGLVRSSTMVVMGATGALLAILTVGMALGGLYFFPAAIALITFAVLLRKKGTVSAEARTA
jgi:hypothetical protein